MVMHMNIWVSCLGWKLCQVNTLYHVSSDHVRVVHQKHIMGISEYKNLLHLVQEKSKGIVEKLERVII